MTLKGVKRKVSQRYNVLAINLPKEMEQQIRSKISQEFKSIQEVFDIFVISGIVLRNAAILDRIDALLPEYINKKSEEIYKRFQGERSDKEYFKISCTILPNDKQALDNYCIDKGYKKAELFHLVFTTLLFDEDEKILSFVNDIRDRDVVRKKKEITKLHEQEYVDVLDFETRRNLLSIFTERLEKNEYAPHIIEAIHEKFYGISVKEKEEEDEIERKLNQKIKSKNLSNLRKVNKIIDESSKYGKD